MNTPVTRYGGLDLAGPITIASGPLTDKFSKIQAAREHGAGAVSLKPSDRRGGLLRIGGAQLDEEIGCSTKAAEGSGQHLVRVAGIHDQETIGPFPLVKQLRQSFRRRIG